MSMTIPALIARLQSLQTTYGDTTPIVMRCDTDGEALLIEELRVNIDSTNGDEVLMFNFDGSEIELDEDEDDDDEEGEDADEDEDDGDDDDERPVSRKVKVPPTGLLSELIARLETVRDLSGNLPVLIAFDDYDMNITKVRADTHHVAGDEVLILHMSGNDVQVDDAEEDDDEDEADEDEADEASEAAADAEDVADSAPNKKKR